MTFKRSHRPSHYQSAFHSDRRTRDWKTTVINGIIAVYAILHKIDLTRNREECPVLLAAPTGRATRRMNELTGLPSATIHRHLGLVEGQEESYRDDYLMPTLSSWMSFLW